MENEIKKHIFIFPNAVRREGEEEKIHMNIENDVFRFFHNDFETAVYGENMRDGSTAVLLSNGVTGSTYVLYNFREILQLCDMTPSELLEVFNHRCFLQIDKSGGEYFVKVFLLEGMNELLSDTDDFSGCIHHTLDYIHELDWEYSWTIRDVKAEVADGMLTISFETVVSDFWKEPIYISHAGQTALCREGRNVVTFRYNETENAYLGAKNSRYKGRAIDLKRLIGGMKDGW